MPGTADATVTATRQVIGTFGAETVHVPRARLVREEGGTSEWRSKALRRYQS